MFSGSGSGARAPDRGVSPLGGRFDVFGSDTRADIRRFDSVRGYPVPASSSSRTTQECVHRQPSNYGVDLSSLAGDANPYARSESRRPSRYDVDLDTLGGGGGGAPSSSSRRFTRERSHRDFTDYQIDDGRYYAKRQPSTRRHEPSVGLDDAFAKLHMQSRGRRPEYGSNRDRYHSSTAELDRVQPVFSPTGFEFKAPNYGRPGSSSRREREVSPRGRSSPSRSHTVQARSHGRRYRQDELFFD